MKSFPTSPRSQCFALILAFFASASAVAAEGTKIRVMAANLSTGNRQNYDSGEGIRIMKGLKADVILVQEFNYKSNSKADLKEMVSAIGGKLYYYVESESSDQIPNGIISRFPILAAGEWEDRGMPNRDFAYARIDIPGDRDLWAISVHWSASKADVRAQEATDLNRLITQNIPARDYVVLGGDFNVTTRNDRALQLLSAVMFERDAPVDSQGNTTTNMPRRKNYDWVLNDADLAAYQVPTTFPSKNAALVEGQNMFSNGLVFDSTIFPKLELVAPIQATDSRAPGMQHLAVVKDYLVPVK